MDKVIDSRGFPGIRLPNYADEEKSSWLVHQSSAIGDYDDAFQRPGTSFLWIGSHHHLNREEVQDLVGHLARWLRRGEI